MNSNNILYEEIIPLKEAKHIFSHIEWQMTGYLVKCRSKPKFKVKWVSKEDLMENYSIPNAFSYFTKYLKEGF